jgi:pyruvate,water dikinase
MSVRWVIHDWELERGRLGAGNNAPAAGLAEIGGKAHNLGRIRGQVPVPEFLVVTSAALQNVLDAQDPTGSGRNLLRRLSDVPGEASESAAEIRALMGRLKWPAELARTLRTALAQRFGEEVLVAVRSSAATEESARHSFAGMYDSVLDVQGADATLEAIQQVWASFFGHRALAYRRRHGLPAADVQLAVIVQRMIAARRSGVMFTCDPVSGDRDEIVIDVVPGSGAKLVQGEQDPETIRARKTDCHPARDGGIAPTTDDPVPGTVETAVPGATPGATQQPLLTDSQVRTASAAGFALERLLGGPQDVEFCFDAEGRFFVLQSRPITAIGESAAQPDNVMIWDNSNIIESYNGVTTPLTFSFIRRAYSIVYQCFAEVMGISPQTVQAHRSTFENMLGLFQGRVYYNLKNWYRLVRLFPGYQYNRGFMETMMGLKEPIVLEEEQPSPGILRRWLVELPALVRLVVSIGWKFRRIESIVGQFQQHFDAHYEQWRRIDFRGQEPHELLALYRHMEDALLWNWKAPIINDFYVMVAYGMLKKLCFQWCDDSNGSLQNGLLCGSGEVPSAEPARRVLELVRTAAGSEALRALILSEPIESLPRKVASEPQFEAFQSLLNRYLDEYGLRCESELKLEQPSYRDRPDQLYQVVRDYLRLGDVAALDDDLHRQRQRDQRQDAERAAMEAISQTSGWLPRRWIFRKVLRAARHGVANREAMRFARTKIYGISRAMFRALGEQLADADALDSAQDIFYLTTDEVWDYVQGTAVSTDLRGLVTTRRREYDAYRAGNPPPPDDRFETMGLPYLRSELRRPDDAGRPEGLATLQGVACCPGVVEGTVQVLQRVGDARGFTGDILVAPRTDPGWVPLFPAFRGMLIERGSALSHSAIVAREMGIPTVVGIRGLLEQVPPGSRVRIDGGRGTVEILSTPRAESLVTSSLGSPPQPARPPVSAANSQGHGASL